VAFSWISAAADGNIFRPRRIKSSLRVPHLPPLGRAVERLRVEAARRLLLESGLPVKRISRHCRFGSEEPMRHSFLQPRRKTTAPGSALECRLL
jgi:AraC-like DNA-binding protein